MILSRFFTSFSGSAPVTVGKKLKQLQKLYQLRVWPEDNMPKKWCTESHEKIANLKQGNTETGEFERILTYEFSPPKDNGLEDILTEFSPEFGFAKPLCRAIRDILFPYGNRGIIVGTPQDPKRLYNPVINAYDDAIAKIKS
ncbi:hypothetical protein ACJ73_07454 [Blastomyces percursus]|uniref:Uncharacterized protein n=1 Tax=Blastomyces percursus TaxID=1658174 RepID=A0A1J9QZF1_9EURO|nr:hypothetical protein ACJ73_07454 [Blastomyces percursus]